MCLKIDSKKGGLKSDSHYCLNLKFRLGIGDMNTYNSKTFSYSGERYQLSIICPDRQNNVNG